MRFIYTKAFALFVVGLVVIVILLFLQVKGLFQPIEYALLQVPRPFVAVARGIARPVHGFFSTLFTIRSVAKENGELMAKVGTLQQQVVAQDQLRLENEIFKKELGFVQKAEVPMQPCTILSIDPEELTDTLILNCGASTGIAEGQAVVSQGYLIGKILHVGQHSSTALLITNAQSAIDARISKNNIEGVVKGSFGSGVVLDLVSQNAELTKGDVVVTAGINSRVARNLLIGEIGEVVSQPNDLFKKVSVLTPIRFHELQYVFVAKQ
jgi:rod shape-determining protein MreC